MIRAVQARDARKRFREMAPVLNEQSLRRFVAMEARALGRGGVSLMSRISGLARSTIYQDLPTFATMFLLRRDESVNPVAAGRRSHPRIRPWWPIL
jgi:hypothetical protein